MHQGSIAPDSSDEDEEFLFDDDICELDEDELRRLEQCAGAYTGQSVEGLPDQSDLKAWLTSCEDTGFTPPPLSAKAENLPPTKANYVDVPVVCVDHGCFLKFTTFVKAILGKEAFKKEQAKVDQTYLHDDMLQQWKPGRMFPAGQGVTCQLVAESIGKVKDIHRVCKAGCEIVQISASGVPIIQCFEHKSKPQYNHLKVAAWWINASSALVKAGFPLKKYGTVWKERLGSQSLLIKYGLLGELYIQQKMDHVAFEAAVKRGDGPKPSKPRLPYRSVGDEGAIITTDTPSSQLSGGSTGNKKKRGRQTIIAFGSPKRAKGGSKGGGRGRGSPNGSRGRGKSPASALTSGKSTQSVALSDSTASEIAQLSPDTKRQLIKELSKQ